MTSKYIVYTDGYKYRLEEDFSILIDIKPDLTVITDYITLTCDGILTVRKNYCWDGCSGPTWDDKTNMRGSLIHDALYQLMRKNLIDADKYRDDADRIFAKICREDGMNVVRDWIYFAGVRLGGKRSTEPENERKLLVAPRKK